MRIFQRLQFVRDSNPAFRERARNRSNLGRSVSTVYFIAAYFLTVFLIGALEDAAAEARQASALTG